VIFGGVGLIAGDREAVYEFCACGMVLVRIKKPKACEMHGPKITGITMLTIPVRGIHLLTIISPVRFGDRARGCVARRSPCFFLEARQ